jgi:NitT/TauT family transport system permease protein
MTTAIEGTTSPEDELDGAGLDRVLEQLTDVRRRERRRRRTIIVTSQVGIVAVLVAAWQLFSGTPGEDPLAVVDSYYVSKPSDVLTTLVSWFADASIWPNLLVTTQETVLGFLIGAASGLTIGLLLGSSRVLGSILYPIVSAINSIPRLALVPLFVLWFGLGLTSKLVFIVSVVFFLVFFSTFDGVRQRPEDLVNTLRVMGANRLQLLTKMVIPSAMTWVFAGLRVSVPFALVAAVTAEIISPQAGLGYLLTRSANQFFVAGVFASIVLMMVLSLVMLGIVVLLQRWLVPWDTAQRDARFGVV